MFGKLSLIMLVSASFLIASNLSAFPLKAKKDKVKVFIEPNKGAEVVSVLSKGDMVTSKGRKGMYWKIQTKDGKSGFVSVMKVKRQSGGESKINTVLREAAKEDRESGNNSSIRSRSAVMGVRGLDASEQVAYAGNTKPDFRLVYRMEDRQVSQKKIGKIESLVHAEIEKRME